MMIQRNRQSRSVPEPAKRRRKGLRSIGYGLLLAAALSAASTPRASASEITKGQAAESTGSTASKTPNAGSPKTHGADSASTLRSEASVRLGMSSPEWFNEHVEFLIAGSGLWIADNSAYRSEQEVAEAYGIHWRPGIGNASARGELFSVEGGRRTDTHWELRVYWDPQLGQARIVQWGHGGMMLSAELKSVGDRRFRAEGHLSRPGGPVLRRAEELQDAEPDVQTNRSLALIDGVWTQDREYRWLRQATDRVEGGEGGDPRE